MDIAYQNKKSFFHSLDPITKFVWAILMSTWIYSIRDLVLISIINVLLTVFVLITARINLIIYFKTALAMLLGGVILILYQGVFQPGPGFDIGITTLSYAGLTLGITISIRVFSMVAIAMAFSSTTRPQEIESSLILIGLPYRLAKVSYLSLMLIPTMTKDFDAILAVYKNRGIKIGMTSIKDALIALIATELRRADEIVIALETRAFGLHEERTKLSEIKITRSGIVLIFATVMFIVASTFY